MHKISPHEQDSGFGELVQESIIPLVFVRKKPHLELIDSESVGDHKRENAFVSETIDLALVTVWVLVILASHDYVVFSVPFFFLWFWNIPLIISSACPLHNFWYALYCFVLYVMIDRSSVPFRGTVGFTGKMALCP